MTVNWMNLQRAWLKNLLNLCDDLNDYILQQVVIVSEQSFENKLGNMNDIRKVMYITLIYEYSLCQQVPEKIYLWNMMSEERLTDYQP